MLVIVSDSFSAAGQIPTLAEKMDRAEVWARLLSGIVPEERLQECFDRAFRQHKSSFPVNAYDLKAAWEEMHRASGPVDELAFQRRLAEQGERR